MDIENSPTDSEGAPQTDPQPAQPAPTSSRPAARQGPGRIWAVLGGLVGLVLIYNLTVWAPAAMALSKDDRNAVAGIHVHRAWLLHPRDITLDLVTVSDEMATVDLTRELLQVAAALKDRSFGKVVLARSGKAVFVLDGADFRDMGAAYEAGENPVYLIRTLPEKLSLPDGRPAFGTWTGGWLGVLNAQLDDLNAFGPAWGTGRPPAASAD